MNRPKQIRLHRFRTGVGNAALLLIALSRIDPEPAFSTAAICEANIRNRGIGDGIFVEDAMRPGYLSGTSMSVAGIVSLLNRA